MYFCIYLKNDIGRIYVRTLAHLDISSIELYDLKQEITKINQDFDAYCLTHSGSYVMLVHDYNPGEKKGELR